MTNNDDEALMQHVIVQWGNTGRGALRPPLS